jgi:hypothetical protein
VEPAPCRIGSEVGVRSPVAYHHHAHVALVAKLLSRIEQRLQAVCTPCASPTVPA